MQYMIELDQINRKILHELVDDGRISNVELAAKVGLSPSACLRRVQDIERAGLIKGYRAVLDPAAIGVGFLAYVTVGLSRHSRDEQYAFENAMMRAEEVRECHNVAGSFEYILRVEARDLPAYKHFHTEVLGALPMVSTFISYIVMGSPKDERA